VTWDEKMLRLAMHIAAWSKDTSTKVGCVITGPAREIRSTGYNGLPRGTNDGIAARYDRPLKYSWFEHAERNAIYNAARNGTGLLGSTLYCGATILGPPCVDCARAAIQSGITRVVCRAGSDDPARWEPRWRDSMLVSLEMFGESGIVFETADADGDRA
jgi:dCMP deaminase